jgi:HK97 gp10 family phage protein
MIRLKVTNIKNVEAALRKYGKDAIDGFEDVIFDEATRMAEVAKLKAPKDFGTLHLSINWAKVNNLHYDVGTEEPYAPFQEFGTGGLVDIPRGWEKMAEPFRGKGIRQVNLEPQPFMYPAYLAGKKTYSKQMKLVIEKLNKDFNNG